MKKIHINCDLGEGGEYDAQLMPLISACNIACGGHAGDAESMLKTVNLAISKKVEMGAHPSYPDRENFGRLSMIITEKELKSSLLQQVNILNEIVKNQGGKLTHFKPHGALYNDAAKDKNIAKIVLDTLLESRLDMSLYAPQNSIISRLAKGKVQVIYEAFADRNYNPDYSLVSRAKSNALITEKEQVFRHLFSMFSKGEILCENHYKIPSIAATFCLHSDTPNAVEILEFLDQEFKKSNMIIAKG